MSNWIKVRIRETGQVTDMVPDVARAMIAGGTAELVGAPETASLSTAGARRAVAPQQKPTQKPAARRK